MAEFKKPDTTSDTSKDYFEKSVFLFFGILFLAAFAMRLMAYLQNWRADGTESLWATIIAFFLAYIWPIVKILAVIVVALCTVGIVYNYRRLKALNLEEQKLYGTTPPHLAAAGSPAEEKNGKWERVIKLINSPNSADWRLAIIEADIMLDELLRSLGYHGETIGDMLKAVEKSDFLTLESAWQAHKVRNNIAHAGSDFLLDERVAKETIAHYEAIFKEFKLI